MLNPLVCDASALVEYLLVTETGRAIADVVQDPNSDVHVPALCDVEVASALRRILSEPGILSAARAEQALADLLDLPMTRHTHEGLVERAFALRDNISIYDGVYVALAEALAAQLITADRALAAAPLPKGVRVKAF